MSLYETSFLIRNFQRAETEAEDGAQESNESPAAKTLKDHWNKKPHRVYFLYELWLQMCSCYAAAAYPYPYLRVEFFPEPLSLWINHFGVELSEWKTWINDFGVELSEWKLDLFVVPLFLGIEVYLI